MTHTATTQSRANATELSERRKADREAMARTVEALAVKHGCTCTRRELPWLNRHAIGLELSLRGGLHLNLDFDGKSCQPNVHVLPWHMRGDVQHYLNPSVFDWNVNPHHGHKATLVRQGSAALFDHLERVMAAAADGSAFTATLPRLARH